MYRFGSIAYVPIWWKFGEPLEYFMREEAFIGKFIAKYKIEAVSRETLMNRVAQVAGGIIIDGRIEQVAGGVIVEGMQAINEMADTRSAKQNIPIKIGPRPWPGGIRGAHLHFKGDAYLLDEKQWGEFSQTILKNIQERLSGAKSVSFEQLMEASEATNSLG